jgi:diguanylate cyclase (GGDEF)-like protein
MNKRLGMIIFLWILALGISFSLGAASTKKNRDKMLLNTAQTFFNQVVVTRKWNASHGGVYVKVTDDTLPNPFLQDPEKNLETDMGVKLTKINPSFMTRQISEITDDQDRIRFHMTSLLPVRPENRPTPWEKKALLAFNQQEITETSELHPGNTPVFVYIKALKAEASCLQCHNTQGYRQGDILGGISVSLFDIPSINLFPVLLMHLAVGSLGLFFIIFYGRKLIRAYGTIRHQAMIDALTQIPNRRYFDQQIAAEFSRSRRAETPISIIMTDIDYFKPYNDVYGHAQGDACLKQVADAIRSAMGRPADFCARFGGEEFIIILPETMAHGALHIAKKIQQTLHDLRISHKTSKVQPFVTLSMGIVTKMASETNVPTIIQMADAALYQAKEKGRDRIEVFIESIGNGNE